MQTQYVEIEKIAMQKKDKKDEETIEFFFAVDIILIGFTDERATIKNIK